MSRHDYAFRGYAARKIRAKSALTVRFYKCFKIINNFNGNYFKP